MAWVKVISKTGNILTMPEKVYEGMYKENEFYSLLKQPEPSPEIKTEKQEGDVDDGKVQDNKNNARQVAGKSTKTSSVQRK